MTTTNTPITSASEPMIVELDDSQGAEALFGPRHENLERLAKLLGIRIHARGNRVTLDSGPDAKLVVGRDLLVQLYELACNGHPVRPEDVTRSVGIASAQSETRLKDVLGDTVLITDRGRRIAPKSLAQKSYVDHIRRNDVVFGIGPAGTGKTYLAMAMAIDALSKKQVRRIILTRPAVEAGEKLGFLPGDLAEKVNPYLRPLNDALNDMSSPEKAQRWLERGEIEVAPLAFMRGRTLNDSFVILDEAQNATRAQMKMFLTRLGFSTKAVITGYITQVDLPANRDSGLSHAVGLLEGIEGIEVNRFTEVDVVRHPLVMKIIRAYDREEDDRQS